MARICVLQNVAGENLGIIAQVLQSTGLEPEYVRTWAGDPVPRYMKDAAGLVVLGGPMGVYDAPRLPFLMDSMRLIDQALKHERPVLGICLGSQLLATVLGSTVRRAGRRELGWLPVALTGDAHADLLWSGSPHRFTAFHWHGDVFDLPAGGTRLASSELTDCQAFVHGLGAYGFLFHLEVTEKTVSDMVGAAADELSQAGADGSEIVGQTPAQIHGLHAVGRPVFQNWAALCLEAAVE